MQLPAASALFEAATENRPTEAHDQKPAVQPALTTLFQKAQQQMRNGKGSVFSVSASSGDGKSPQLVRAEQHLADSFEASAESTATTAAAVASALSPESDRDDDDEDEQQQRQRQREREQRLSRVRVIFVGETEGDDDEGDDEGDEGEEGEEVSEAELEDLRAFLRLDRTGGLPLRGTGGSLLHAILARMESGAAAAPAHAPAAPAAAPAASLPRLNCGLLWSACSTQGTWRGL